ncbi:MAG: metal ABC transporter substrate-binding protein [Propionibacteriaceae bacterium]|nr:metal ABC transporter substrate-binding protein [Propionibacteriaceae bacterium]
MKHGLSALLVIGLVCLAGCSPTSAPTGAPAPSTTSSTAPTPQGTLSVVAGLYPYAYLAEALGGDHVVVTNLTKPGAEPHDLELTTQQVASIGSASLVIYEATLQPAVDAAITQTTPAHELDVTSVIKLVEREAPGSTGTIPDPHVWLDPVHMQTLAQAITAQLKQIDPANAADYDANLDAVNTTLADINYQYSMGLAQCERQAFITTHEAFGYLADRYHLTQIPISGVSPDAEPSPERIAEIQSIATKDGITTIFFETLVSPALAQSIANDLNLATDILDPLEGITDQSRGTDYPSVMSSNLTALKKANGCA